MSKVVRLPQYKWSEHEREVEYHLPDSWDVTTYNFAVLTVRCYHPHRSKLLLPLRSGCRVATILLGAK